MRYSLIGVVCATMQSAIMILGDVVGYSYVVLTIAAFAVVTPIGYLLHASFTFRERLSMKAFLRFSSGAATGFPVALMTMAALCSGAHVPVILASPLTTVILFMWNFAAAHWAIRRRLGTIYP
jgi:putative flippase GtrA